MLDAVLHDLGRCSGVRTVTLLDALGPKPAHSWPNNTAVLVGAAEPASQFVDLARQADFTLVIAPEFDNLLLERCRQVEECGGHLLGPSAEAVRLTGDKLRLAEHLRSRHVSTPNTYLWNWSNTIASPPAVVKPRFGAGSQATFLLRKNEDCAAAAAQANAEGWDGEMIQQPFCAGAAASVAFLLGPKARLTLPAAAQHLSTDGRFRYLGGSLPLPPDLNARAQRLAAQAVEAVDGLLGYVGVDLVLGLPEDGSEDVVIEINPRLTTSYAGLRRLANSNLAEMLLAVAKGTTLPSLTWRATPIRFRGDGTTEEANGE